MSKIPPPSGAPVTRLTGFVLALVVFVCLVMIAVAGYLKYQLDQAEAVLASPEYLNTDAEFYDRLRRSLGYSGFLGIAQNYAASHDNALISDMKAQVKIAEDAAAHMPDKVPVEIRRDLSAIVGVFSSTMQRIEKNATEPLAVLTNQDLASLYAALPLLDARITTAATSNRATAQSQVQFWAMLLTLVAWSSLIIAAAMSVGIYLILRDRNSAPMRALAQSVRNMAHGDLRTSIWGMERTDVIGDLARSIDQARYHFSQLPDLTLISDKGPVRMRFEGNTKSIFEAMINHITRDSENMRAQSAGLTEAIDKQQQSITMISSQVESILKDVVQRGQLGELQVKQALQEMLGSANALKNAHEHATDQLSRLVPYLQDRAKGLNEITQITGTQVAQVLKGLLLTERSLKNSAEESEAAISKLTGTADDLGNRLFGALNLLQASGKVLAETTESTKSRLDHAIEQLQSTALQAATPEPEEEPDTTARDESIARLEGLIESLETAHAKLEEVIGEQTEAAKNQIDFLSSHSANLLTQSSTTALTLSNAADHLREEQEKLGSAVQAVTEKLENSATRLEQASSEAAEQKAETTATNDAQTQLLLNGISTQLFDLAEKMAEIQQQQTTASKPEDKSGLSETADKLLIELRTGFETTVRSLGDMREQMVRLVISNQSGGNASNDQQWQALTTQIESTRSGLAAIVKQQIEELEQRLGWLSSKTAMALTPPAATPVLPPEAQEQMEQQTQILTELVATLGVLDAHMQQIKSDMRARG